MELLALTMSRAPKAKSLRRAYHRNCSGLGGVIQVLTQTGVDDLKQICGDNLAYAVIKIWMGQAELASDCDGRYGMVCPAV